MVNAIDSIETEEVAHINHDSISKFELGPSRMGLAFTYLSRLESYDIIKTKGNGKAAGYSIVFAKRFETPKWNFLLPQNECCVPWFPIKLHCCFYFRHTKIVSAGGYQRYIMFQRSSESVPAMAGIEEEQLKMVNAGTGDQKWIEKMMTVDCLRGRLLAERNTSKVAREEAELMGRRLVELERQLKMEIESQRKAEKMLKLAMKKLESLKLSPSVSQSNSSVTESFSSPPSQVRKKQEDSKQIADSKSYNIADPSLSNNFAIVEDDPVHQMIISGSPGHSDTHEVTSKADACHVNNSNSSDCTSSPIGKSPPGGENQNREDNYVETVDNSLALVTVEEKIESVDNSQALVPLDPMDHKSSNDNHVYEVLLALRQARQQLQASIGRTTVYGSHSFGLCGV